MSYQLSPAGVVRLADGAVIPSDPENAAWQAYLAWVDAGHIAAPEEVHPPRVPELVTMRQARLALLEAGTLSAVNAAVAAMPGAVGDAARIEWEFSSTVERHRSLVGALAGALKLSTSQLDALFIRAAEL